MKPVPLNAGNYNGTYKLIGEELSLDFINTVSWPRMEGEHDWLDQPANFIAWALATRIINPATAGLVVKRSHTKLMKEMRVVHTTRTALDKVLRPLSYNKRPDQEAIKKLDELVHKSYRLRHINPKNVEWAWDNPVSLVDILAPVIWNAASILTGIEHSRIRHCPACKWLFYDATRNRSRKWCDMDDCGSRDKALRYYHRQK